MYLSKAQFAVLIVGVGLAWGAFSLLFGLLDLTGRIQPGQPVAIAPTAPATPRQAVEPKSPTRTPIHSTATAQPTAAPTRVPPTATPTAMPTPMPTATPTPTPMPKPRDANRTVRFKIDPRRTHEERISLRRGARLDVSFKIVDNDVRFSFWMDSPIKQAIIKPDRVRSNYQFTFVAAQDGEYSLSFDNTYSFFKTKNIELSYSITEP